MNQDQLADALVGRTIDQSYFLEVLLGTGGMGAVYRARHVKTGERRALKFLLPVRPLHSHERRKYLRRFHREADVIASLWHPNIVRVQEAGSYDFLDATTGKSFLIPYIVMEYIEQGKTLDDILHEHGGALLLQQALPYIDQIASALTYLHQQRIVHRDLKPSNLLLDPMGKLVLADFGIAHIANSTLTATNDIVGTPAYSAPEIDGTIQVKDIDGRVDIYALGVILYEMLMGELPHAAPSDGHLSLPSEIDVVFRKATARHPRDRYKDVQQFVHAVRLAASQICNDKTLVIQAAESSFRRTDRRQSGPWSLIMSRIEPLSSPMRRIIGSVLIALALLGCFVVSPHVFSSPSAVLQQNLTLPNQQTTSTASLLEEAKNAVTRYYHYWDQKNYQAAYDLLDPAYQQQQAFETLLPYYQHTHKSCVTVERVAMVADSQARVEIIDNAIEDDPTREGTATNLYKGYFMVSHQGSGWKLTPYLHLQSVHGTCY